MNVGPQSTPLSLSSPSRAGTGGNRCHKIMLAKIFRICENGGVRSLVATGTLKKFCYSRETGESQDIGQPEQDWQRPEATKPSRVFCLEVRRGNPSKNRGERPYHFGSVIAEEFRPSAGYVLQRPRPGNPYGESRTKLNAVMGENLPRPRRRQRAGEKADGLAPKGRGWDFLMLPEGQGKPLASTKRQGREELKLNSEYAAYLLSEDWRRKRLQRLEIAQNRCSACRNSKAVQVHHLTYARIFKEEMADLLPLCDFHHDAAESLIKKGELTRNGDVLFLAAETLRLIVPLSPYTPTPKPPRESGLNGAIECRNDVQRDLLSDPHFIAALSACYDRRSIKLWLRHYAKKHGGNRSKSKVINNGVILFDRYKARRGK